MGHVFVSAGRFSLERRWVAVAFDAQARLQYLRLAQWLGDSPQGCS
jgi:hypothetical protein